MDRWKMRETECPREKPWNQVKRNMDKGNGKMDEAKEQSPPPHGRRAYTELSQGCLRICEIVIRRETSTSRHDRIRCSTSGERRTLGRDSLPTLAASASENGHSPVTRIERRTPSDHTSDGGAWYVSPRRISADAKDCTIKAREHIACKEEPRMKRAYSRAMESVVQGCRLSRIEDDSRAKVDELDSEIVRDDNVFILDVSVANSDLAEGVYNFDDLSKDIFGCRVVEATVLLDASAAAEAASVSDSAV